MRGLRLTTTANEFARLGRVYERLGYPLKQAPPASDAQIAAIASTTGIEVDESLKELWRISNGSRGYAWFAAGEDEDFAPHAFLSIKEALSLWKLFAPYDEEHYAKWYDDESWGERDRRVQRHLIRHCKWLSFTQVGGASNELLFDADPTDAGNYGQVIEYVHDPDGIFWSADSFLEFFQRSNDLLEEFSDDPEFLAESLELADQEVVGPGLRSPETCHPRTFEFDGFRITWPESEPGRASHWQLNSDAHLISDAPYKLYLDNGKLVFEDDGLEFEYGNVETGDHIRVAGYNEIYVNDELRKPIDDA